MIDFNGGNKPEIITNTLVRVCLCAVYGNKPRKLPRELLILTWCLIFFYVTTVGEMSFTYSCCWDIYGSRWHAKFAIN